MYALRLFVTTYALANRINAKLGAAQAEICCHTPVKEEEVGEKKTGRGTPSKK